MDVSELEMEGAPPSIFKKIKRVDPLRALEMVGRHVQVQAFKDKIDIEVTEGAVNDLHAGRERARKAMQKGKDDGDSEA
jgi:phage terminase small subunit